MFINDFFEVKLFTYNKLFIFQELLTRYQLCLISAKSTLRRTNIQRCFLHFYRRVIANTLYAACHKNNLWLVLVMILIMALTFQSPS